MVTPDGEDKRVLKDLAAALGTTNSKKWDLVDLSKKNSWMISTLAALSEDQEAKTAVLKGPPFDAADAGAPEGMRGGDGYHTPRGSVARVGDDPMSAARTLRDAAEAPNQMCKQGKTGIDNVAEEAIKDLEAGRGAAAVYTSKGTKTVPSPLAQMSAFTVQSLIKICLISCANCLSMEDCEPEETAVKDACRMAKEDLDEGRATYADPDPLYSANRKTTRVIFFTKRATPLEP